MSELTRRTPNQVSRPANKNIESHTNERRTSNGRSVVKRPNRIAASVAFPTHTPGLTAVGRVVERPSPEYVYITKRVLDSQLKHVLAVFGVFLTLSLLVGLILWVMS